MAQQYILENDTVQTVDFSTIGLGEIFIYNSFICVKLDKNNPNYGVLESGDTGKLNDIDQVVYPNSVLLKLE